MIIMIMTTPLMHMIIPTTTTTTTMVTIMGFSAITITPRTPLAGSSHSAWCSTAPI
ncbi:hypothetical protein [Acetobacter sp.]|uniref:hypothetical protein n=1 Tax=Acetobacter sp. TaxID=440 RepID=UPI0039E7F485